MLTAYKVDETIFRGILNGDRESLTLSTLQNFFNETIKNFSEKWILILDDQNDCYDFSVPSGHRFLGHKYCILTDYETKSRYKIGIPNPKGITSIENRQKFVIIYERQSLSSENIDTLFQKYLKNNKSNYIVSDLKYILIDTFSALFEKEKDRYIQTMKNRPDSRKPELIFSEIYDTFASYNIDEKSIASDKESLFKKLKGLFELQSVNRKDILFKDYSTQKLILLIDFGLDTFDLMRTINEYVRGDALAHLDREDRRRRSYYFNYFNSILLEDFRDKAITEDTLKIVRERISEKIEDIQEKGSQFKELANNQNKFSYFILRRKKHSGNGFKSFEFRSKEFLYKLQLKTKGIFSETISRIKQFGKKCVQTGGKLIRITWIQVLIGYIALSALTGFFQALFNGDIKLSDLFK